MEYTGEVKYLLHDVNNQLSILNGLAICNKDKLQESHYLKFLTCSKIISQKINSIDLLYNDNYKNYISKLNFSDVPSEINSIIEGISAIYPPIMTDFEVININSQVYYNKALMEQILMNVLDNSRKSRASSISIKIKAIKDAIVIELTDDGSPYQSDSSSLFQGVGKKIIHKISQQKKYSVDFKPKNNGYLVKITMNAVK